MSGLRAAVKRSAALAALERGVDAVRTAARHSRVGRVVGLGKPDARTVEPDAPADRSGSPVPDSVRVAVDESVLGRGGRRLETVVHTATRTARVTEFGRRIATYGRHSFGYRWLTAEPEPDVIVIDLRRTWSVGPVLAALDRAITAVLPGVERATLTRVATRVGDAVRGRPVAVASLVLLGGVTASFLATALGGGVTVDSGAVHVVGAALAVLGLRSRTTLAELRRTRTVRILAAAFEPPEPPAASMERPSTDEAATEDEDASEHP